MMECVNFVFFCLFVRMYFRSFFSRLSLSKRPSSFCLIHFGGSSGAAQGQLGGGRRPLMEDDFRWKKTFDGKRPLMEDDLRWKITYDGRRHIIEDDI